MMIKNDPRRCWFLLLPFTLMVPGVTHADDVDPVVYRNLARDFFDHNMCEHVVNNYNNMMGSPVTFENEFLDKLDEQDQLIAALCQSEAVGDDGHYDYLAEHYREMDEGSVITHLLNQADALKADRPSSLVATYSLAAYQLAKRSPGISAQEQLNLSVSAVDALERADLLSLAVNILHEQPRLLARVDASYSDFLDQALKHATVAMLAARYNEALEAYAVALHYLTFVDQSQVAAASLYLSRGQAAFEHGDYPLAVINLEESYALSEPDTIERGVVAFRLSQAFRKQSMHVQAALFAEESVVAHQLDYALNASPDRALALANSLIELSAVNISQGIYGSVPDILDRAEQLLVSNVGYTNEYMTTLVQEHLKFLRFTGRFEEARHYQQVMLDKGVVDIVSM